MNLKATNETYTRAVGRRKEAVAQVRLTRGTGKITINGRDIKEYFPHSEWQKTIEAPFVANGTDGTFDVSVKVSGGGIRGQADGVRLAIARALCIYNPDARPALKKLGYLRRDARVKERKKYGKKKARRSPQWSKR